MLLWKWKSRWHVLRWMRRKCKENTLHKKGPLSNPQSKYTNPIFRSTVADWHRLNGKETAHQVHLFLIIFHEFGAKWWEGLLTTASGASRVGAGGERWAAAATTWWGGERAIPAHRSTPARWRLRLRRRQRRRRHKWRRRCQRPPPRTWASSGCSLRCSRPSSRCPIRGPPRRYRTNYVRGPCVILCLFPMNYG